jgi:septal ring factor EnvC (AmiA/AmiB activator)
MRRPALRFALVLLLAMAPLASPLAQPAVESVEQRKQDAQKAKAALRERIAEVQARLDQKSAQFRRASDELKQSESAISAATRRLRALDQSLGQTQQALVATQTQIAATESQLQADRDALAAQLRAQHRSQLSAFSALLSGTDPQLLGRELGYLSFVAQARAQVIEDLREGVAELSRLKTTKEHEQSRLQEQQQAVKAERQTLEQQKRQREQLLVELEGSLAAERAERDKLARDEQQLGELIDSLGQELADIKADVRHAQAIRQEILQGLPEGEGIKRGIPMPLRGSILARYGSSRPDGGDWRGTVIKASDGAPVKAVAAGTVVYATWLRGFGNLIIVDHGDEFLTVYAYNQSLLKQVGDTVRSGDVIAEAGNSGGQLDSALYFELRHRGKPLDPQLYFKQ